MGEGDPLCLPMMYLRGGVVVASPTDTKPCMLAGGDPVEVAKALSLIGEVAVIDLDRVEASWRQTGQTGQTESKGDNSAVIKEILNYVQCRIGGGIQTADEALDWLDIGATQVIIGTKASAELLSEIPNSRVCVAIDVHEQPGGVQGEDLAVTTHSRTEKAAAGCGLGGLAERLGALHTEVDECLITFVDFKGDKSGFMEYMTTIQSITSKMKLKVSVAGGIEDVDTVWELWTKHSITMALGESLLSSRLSLGDVVVKFLVSDRPDGLYPTTVVDEQFKALGLVYSDDNSIRAALERRRGIYHSRKRGLWEKGLTSGAVQELLQVKLDCDNDALLYVVTQKGTGFCHLNKRSCWDSDRGVAHLFRTLRARMASPDPSSYTNRLLQDRELLHSKLLEESQELIEAKTKAEVASECADVVYFASVVCARAGVGWEDVETWLDNRSRRIRRRKGDAKPDKGAGADKKQRTK